MIFGIDGGGTRSRIRVEDSSGKLILEALGYSTNIYSVGAENVKNNLIELINSACKKAEISTRDIKSCCIGSAGLDRSEETNFFESIIHCVCPNTKIKLCTDAEIMLVGGLKSYTGYCLIAGTGSIALARNKSGELKRSGGLGYMLGDEGSALWIAYEAIKRAYKSYENRDIESNLIYELINFFNLKKPNEFIALVHKHFDKATIAKACPLVFEQADKGDKLAINIIDNAIKELTLLVQSIVKAMPLINKDIVLAGGVLENNAYFYQRLTKELLDIGLNPTKAKSSAEYGACMLARLL